MLTIKILEEFEARLRNGLLEQEFKCASEEGKMRILELLEKIMDVADLSDEVATRLIFRGALPTGKPQ